MYDLIEYGLAWIAEKLSVEVVGAIVAAVVIALAFEFWRISRASWRRISAFFGARAKLRRFDREITRVRRDGRWNRPVRISERRLQRQMRKSIPIIMIANYKGGVGKTTLAANLGAYFAVKRSLDVLYIDLDFQGTLSSTLNSIARVREDDTPRIHEIFREDFPHRRIEQLFDRRQSLAGVFPKRSRSSDHQGDLRFSAYYDASDAFADIEDWLMLKWVGDRSKSDVRFLLARFLQTPQVQKAFDVVIIDAPPRNTTGGVNAFCAATDIITPSRADKFSLDGARHFLETASASHDLLAPNARFLGFVATMVRGAADERPRTRAEEDLIRDLETKSPPIRRAWTRKSYASYWPMGSHFSFIGDLLQRSTFAEDAGLQISYIQDKEVRDMIDGLGDEIVRRMGEERLSKVQKGP